MPKVLLLVICLVPASSYQIATAQTLPEPTRLLHHADEIRRLTAEQAARSYPVKIRGVVTGDVPAPDFFVQDSTAGIYVEGSHSPIFQHHLGDLIEVEGVTGPGKFAPVIREQSSRVLGNGKLPHGKLYSFNELADGQLDSQWVKVRGTIRSVSIDRTSWRETALAMRVASGNGEFAVRVPLDREQDFASWVDREVLIEGVCGSLFTSQRQLSGILFYVPRLNFIRIEPSAQESSISGLLQFSPGKEASRRVRIRGVVVYQQPGNGLFLQNGDRGVRIQTQQQTPVEIGDVVEAFGFPVAGESTPMLINAVFNRIGHGAPPVPLKFKMDAPWENYDGALVTIDALLLNKRTQESGLRLLLRTGDYVFEADSPHVEQRLLSFPLNAVVRVTGVGLVRSGGLWSAPESFRLLLRSPDDLILLRAPSWWNLRHAMWMLGLTAGVLLLVLAWVAVLGKRLREQMAIVRQRLRSSAVLEERNRIARELHDTLEQELAGITMQLDLASDCFEQVPGVARNAIETARRMSRHSMLEARRSVWDLRCHLLESGDLITALTEITKPLASRDQIKITIQTSGSPARLPSRLEMNLLRIAQEAVANAVKHSGGTEIKVNLEYAPGRVALSIRDDGHGFVPAPLAGHFGLLDIRERAESMGCQLAIESRPGAGTSVAVEVAIPDRHPADEEPKAHTYSGG